MTENFLTRLIERTLGYAQVVRPLHTSMFAEEKSYTGDHFQSENLYKGIPQTEENPFPWHYPQSVIPLAMDYQKPEAPLLNAYGPNEDPQTDTDNDMRSGDIRTGKNGIDSSNIRETNGNIPFIHHTNTDLQGDLPSAATSKYVPEQGKIPANASVSKMQNNTAHIQVDTSDILRFPARTADRKDQEQRQELYSGPSEANVSSDLDKADATDRTHATGTQQADETFQAARDNHSFSPADISISHPSPQRSHDENLKSTPHDQSMHIPMDADKKKGPSAQTNAKVSRTPKAYLLKGESVPVQTGINTYERGAPPGHPAIRVTIGRIEVHAVMPPAKPVQRDKYPPAAPALSLDDYLKQRDRGRG